MTGRLLNRALLAEMQTTVPFEPTMPKAGGYGLGISWLATAAVSVAGAAAALHLRRPWG